MIFYMWCGKNCYSISYIILFITVKKIENRSIFNRNIAKYSSAILETRYIGACPNYSEIFLPVYTRLGYAPLIQPGSCCQYHSAEFNAPTDTVF